MLSEGHGHPLVQGEPKVRLLNYDAQKDLWEVDILFATSETRAFVSTWYLREDAVATTPHTYAHRAARLPLVSSGYALHVCR